MHKAQAQVRDFMRAIGQPSTARLAALPPHDPDVPKGDDSMTEHIMQFFAYDHLPADKQAISRPFGELAAVVMTLPRNPERTVALRKLLEAKDAAVRASFARDVA